MVVVMARPIDPGTVSMAASMEEGVEGDDVFNDVDLKK